MDINFVDACGGTKWGQSGRRRRRHGRKVNLRSPRLNLISRQIIHYQKDAARRNYTVTERNRHTTANFSNLRFSHRPGHSQPGWNRKRRLLVGRTGRWYEIATSDRWTWRINTFKKRIRTGGVEGLLPLPCHFLHASLEEEGGDRILYTSCMCVCVCALLSGTK